MTMDVKITGLKDLSVKMRQMGPKLTRKHARRGTRQGANKVRDALRVGVPRDTGRLARNIFAKGRRSKSGYAKASVYVRVGEKYGKKLGHHDIATGQFLPKQGGATGRKDPKDGYYWRFLEYGTKHMTARPFIAVISRANFNRVVKIIFREIDTGIEQDLAKATRAKR